MTLQTRKSQLHSERFKYKSDNDEKKSARFHIFVNWIQNCRPIHNLYKKYLLKKRYRDQPFDLKILLTKWLTISRVHYRFISSTNSNRFFYWYTYMSYIYGGILTKISNWLGYWHGHYHIEFLELRIININLPP